MPREGIKQGPFLIKGRNQLQITQAKKQKSNWWNLMGKVMESGASWTSRCQGPASLEPEQLWHSHS